MITSGPVGIDIDAVNTAMVEIATISVDTMTGVVVTDAIGTVTTVTEHAAATTQFHALAGGTTRPAFPI